jgi:hypothetical protein
MAAADVPQCESERGELERDWRIKKEGAPLPTKGEGGIGRQRTRQHLGKRN